MAPDEQKPAEAPPEAGRLEDDELGELAGGMCIEPDYSGDNPRN
jgi:hypothetical protein